MKNNKKNKELFRIKILRNKDNEELGRNVETFIYKNKINNILDIKFSNCICKNNSQEFFSAMIFY